MSYMMKCPNCGKMLKADLEKIGRTVGCNACRKPFVHPGADELIARVKFADDPATAPKPVAAAASESPAAYTHQRKRSPVVWAASLACVAVVAGGLYVYANRGSAEAGGAFAAFRNSPDLPTVDELLADDRPYSLNLANNAAGAGIRMDATAGTASLNRKGYQPTNTFLEAEELRRLLEESRAEGREPMSVVVRDADGYPMLFLSNLYVVKPGLAGWLREVRDRSRISPPFTIAAAVDSAGNIYVETIRDASGGSPAQPEVQDRD